MTTYQYNGLNQLCMVQYPNGNQVTYAYDGNGNRTAKSGGGNILRAYAYDWENHMVQASGPGGILGNYYYNADGLRIAKVTAAGTVGFIYDAMKLLQEVGATGQTTATYTSTGGRPESGLLGIANSAGSHVPLMDALGSVRLLLDSSQNVSDGYVYEAFGREVSGGGLTPNPYHFVGAYGYYQDWETGLQLLTARYYDAEVGRFVTRDPIGFGGGDWNIYGYVLNSPSLRTDPDGLLPQWIITGGNAIGQWVAGIPAVVKWIGGGILTIGGVMVVLLAVDHWCSDQGLKAGEHVIHKIAKREIPYVAVSDEIQYVPRTKPLSKTLNSNGSTTVTWEVLVIPRNTIESEVEDDANHWTLMTFTVPPGADPNTPPVIPPQP